MKKIIFLIAVLIVFAIFILVPKLPLKKLEFSYMERTHFSKVGETGNAYWDRIWIFWGDVERKKGVYDFSFVDRIVKMEGERNAILLITIEPFAEWDQDKCHGEEYRGSIPILGGTSNIKVGKPCSMGDYREFLKKFVERYDGDGIDDMPGLRYPVKYWEIVNEPGLQGDELKFFHGTSQEYLEILKTSYEVIKEVDEDAKIVMGGMAGMHTKFVEFWSPIIKEAGNYFDIANIHSIDSDERREDLFVLKFKKFLEENGINKSIWITEAQFGPLKFEQGKRVLSEEEMNKLIARSTVLSLAFGADKIFFVSENWYGSSMKVYETLVKKINNFDSVEVINQSYVENEDAEAGVSSIYGHYKFNVGNKSVYVLWGTGKLSQILEGKVKVTDIYGNERTVNADEVNLTEIPIFVEK